MCTLPIFCTQYHIDKHTKNNSGESLTEIEHVLHLDARVRTREGEPGLLDSLNVERELPKPEEGPDGPACPLHLRPNEGSSNHLQKFRAEHSKQITSESNRECILHLTLPLIFSVNKAN